MSTTSLFVELLIIGLETVLWVTLLIGSIFGMDWLVFLSTIFEKAGLVASVIFFSVAYFFGIIVDEIADTLTGFWSKRIRNSYQEANLPLMWDVIAYVFSHSKEGTEQLTYIRSRGRVVRASIFNLALSGIFSIIYLWKQNPVTEEIKVSLTWFIGITGVILVGATLYVFKRMEENYWVRTRSLYKALMPSLRSKPISEKQTKKG